MRANINRLIREASEFFAETTSSLDLAPRLPNKLSGHIKPAIAKCECVLQPRNYKSKDLASPSRHHRLARRKAFRFLREAFKELQTCESFQGKCSQRLDFICISVVHIALRKRIQLNIYIEPRSEKENIAFYSFASILHANVFWATLSQRSSTIRTF